MVSEVYNVYDCKEDDGRYKTVVRVAGRKKAGAVTRRSYMRAISAFYGWCVRKGFRLDNEECFKLISELN